jgi:hypothetical protein
MPPVALITGAFSIIIRRVEQKKRLQQAFEIYESPNGKSFIRHHCQCHQQILPLLTHLLHTVHPYQ